MNIEGWIILGLMSILLVALVFIAVLKSKVKDEAAKADIGNAAANALKAEQELAALSPDSPEYLAKIRKWER